MAKAAPLSNWDYAFDALDQLIAVSRDGAVVEEYRYDALGRRSLIATAGADDVAVVSDGPDRFLDLVDDGASGAALQARYSHGAEVDEPLQMEAFDATGALSGRFTYHADHLGSIRFLTDAAGNIANEYDYDSYGNRLMAVETVAQPFSFTGREWSAATDLYDYRARVYDPDTGRFLQEDPIWFSAGDLNVYRYVWNSPLSWTDPTGLAAASESASTSRISTGLIGPLATLGRQIACIFGTVASVLNVINEVNGDSSVTLESVEVLSLACGAKATVKKRRRTTSCSAPSRGLGRLLSGFFSFPKGTLIWREDGFVSIEDISVGDLVWSRDEESGENKLNPVTELFRRETAEMTVLRLKAEEPESNLMQMVSMDHGKQPKPSLHTLRLTPEHPVYVLDRFGDETGWVMAGDLAPGDLVADIDGGAAVKVVSNDLEETSETVYNFAVAKAHNYFADELGLWVHNGNDLIDPFSDHAKERLKQRGITRKMALTVWAKGTKSFNRKNGSITSILTTCSGKKIGVGRNPFTGIITTVFKRRK